MEVDTFSSLLSGLIIVMFVSFVTAAINQGLSDDPDEEEAPKNL